MIAQCIMHQCSGLISLTKEATFPGLNLSFSTRLSLNYYSNNVKLLPLSKNKVSHTEKQIILKGMLTELSNVNLYVSLISGSVKKGKPQICGQK